MVNMPDNKKIWDEFKRRLLPKPPISSALQEDLKDIHDDRILKAYSKPNIADMFADYESYYPTKAALDNQRIIDKSMGVDWGNPGGSITIVEKTQPGFKFTPINPVNVVILEIDCDWCNTKSLVLVHGEKLQLMEIINCPRCGAPGINVKIQSQAQPEMRIDIDECDQFSKKDYEWMLGREVSEKQIEEIWNDHRIPSSIEDWEKYYLGKW